MVSGEYMLKEIDFLAREGGVDRNAAALAVAASWFNSGMTQLATILSRSFLEKAEKVVVPVPLPAPVQSPVPEQAPVSWPPPGTPPIEPLKTLFELSDVRQAFARAAQNGYKQDCLGMLERFNVKNVTQLKPEDYPAVMSALSALGSEIE